MLNIRSIVVITFLINIVTMPMAVYSATEDVQSQTEKEMKQGLIPGVDYPRINLNFLNNPDTLGLTLKWKNDNLIPLTGRLLAGENVKSENISVFKDMPRAALGIDLNLTASKDYHPSEDSKFAVKGTYNWSCDKLCGAAPVDQIYEGPNHEPITVTVYRPYPGSLNLDFGGEAAPDKRGTDGQSWKFKDYNVGLTLNQQVPKTDLDPLSVIIKREDDTNNLGKIPIIVSTFYKRVFQTNPSTDQFNREGIALDWGIPLIGSLGSYSSYIYPHTEWNWNDNKAAKNFTSVDLDIYINGVDKYFSWLKSVTPVIFVRYENGYKAPVFTHINAWHAGVGSTILW